MNEEEFDAASPFVPFGSADAARMEARWRRGATLGVKLWGTTAVDLQRQLLGSHPEIPPGYNLADFRSLLRYTGAISAALSDPKRGWSLLGARSCALIHVGADRYTEWEARAEIVRRAIDYLERR